MGLWEYNVRYLRGFGRRLASLEAFRRLLQQLSDEDMNFGFEKRLLEAGDLMAANRGDGIPMGLFEKLKRFKRGISRFRLLMDLHRAAHLMKKMDRLYSNYPSSPDRLNAWNRSVLEIVESATFGHR